MKERVKLLSQVQSWKKGNYIIWSSVLVETKTYPQLLTTEKYNNQMSKSNIGEHTCTNWNRQREAGNPSSEQRDPVLLLQGMERAGSTRDADEDWGKSYWGRWWLTVGAREDLVNWAPTTSHSPVRRPPPASSPHSADGKYRRLCIEGDLWRPPAPAPS